MENGVSADSVYKIGEEIRDTTMDALAGAGSGLFEDNGRYPFYSI